MIKYISLILLALATSVWTITAATVYQITFINVALITGLIFVLKPGYRYLLWALSIGLLLDYFTGAPGLFYTIIFLGTFFLMRYINSLFSHENLIRFFLLSLFAVIVYHILIVTIAFLYSRFNVMQFNFNLTELFNLGLFLEVVFTFIFIIIIRFISVITQSRKPNIVA